MACTVGVSSTLVSGNNSLALVICSRCESLSMAAALLGGAHPLPALPSPVDFISRPMAEWVSMLALDQGISETIRVRRARRRGY
jgi:hypothetical protein